MKKLALIFALLFSISIWFSPASLLGDRAVNDGVATFALPASLVMIGDEAFEETASEVVILPDSLLIIGEKSFAGSRSLKMIYIPASVVYIGEHTFDDTSNLTIRGLENSYAAQWAQEHSIAFTQFEAALFTMEKLRDFLKNGLFMLLVFCFSPASVTFLKCKKTAYREKSMRPQDRPELNPIDYKFP